MMNINNLKTIFSILASSALFAFPLLASAKALTIENVTKKPFTVSINNYCSDAVGVIKVKGVKVIAEDILSQLCGSNSSNCIGKIFKSNNCSGAQLADFNFDTKTGLKNDFHATEKYSLTVHYPTNHLSLTQAL